MSINLYQYIKEQLLVMEEKNLTEGCELCGYITASLYKRCVSGKIMFCCAECAEDIPLTHCPDCVDDIID
jgi:hypothetical protein